MGISMSRLKRSRQRADNGEQHNNAQIRSSIVESITKDIYNIDRARWFDLLTGLQEVATLQRAATRSLIDTRQKKREASFKQEDVAVSDARFMEELQRLNARGKLVGFEHLSTLAADCQAARDLLGPLEQDNIEAESQWQGHVWTLREAEEDLYAEFESEFQDAAEYVGVQAGEEASSHRSGHDLDIGHEHVMIEEPQEQQEPEIQKSENAFVTNFQPTDKAIMFPDAGSDNMEESWMSDLDSGFGDLDSNFETEIAQADLSSDSVMQLHANRTGPPQQLPQWSGTELYHDLNEDFSTRRDRINKWLKYGALQSRLEAVSIFSILHDKLKLEDKDVPSNWAQLVIAFWELDDASKNVEILRARAGTEFKETVDDVIKPRETDLTRYTDNEQLPFNVITRTPPRVIETDAHLATNSTETLTLPEEVRLPSPPYSRTSVQTREEEIRHNSGNQHALAI